ncbi:hypothetical protein KQX54_016393, partial [Cotesia glomerata]
MAVARVVLVCGYGDVTLRVVGCEHRIRKLHWEQSRVVIYVHSRSVRIPNRLDDWVSSECDLSMTFTSEYT